MRLWAAAALAAGVLWGGVAAPARAQMLRDPLTPAEAEQVRNTAGQLDHRIPLLLKFAEARLTAFEQLRIASPRPPGRDAQLYDLLRQYKEIVPELDDAIDDLSDGATTSESSGKKYNLRKILDPAIAAVTRLQEELRHIQTASSPADLGNYHFALQDCLDVTSDSLQNAQEALPHEGKEAERKIIAARHCPCVIWNRHSWRYSAS